MFWVIVSKNEENVYLRGENNLSIEIVEYCQKFANFGTNKNLMRWWHKGLFSKLYFRVVAQSKGLEFLCMKLSWFTLYKEKIFDWHLDEKILPRFFWRKMNCNLKKFKTSCNFGNRSMWGLGKEMQEQY